MTRQWGSGLSIDGAVCTRQSDADGGEIEIVDFCPYFRRKGRSYRPVAFVRIVRPVSGSPRIAVRVRPTSNWGSACDSRIGGSNHILSRFAGAAEQMTDALLVNPHSAEEISDALRQALSMPLEQSMAGGRSSQVVQENDVIWWMKRFTDELQQSGHGLQGPDDLELRSLEMPEGPRAQGVELKNATT